MSLGGVRKTLSQLGLGNGLAYLSGRLLASATGGRCKIVRYRFVAQPIPADVTPLPEGATVIKSVDATHPLVPTFPRPAHVIERRFRQGDTCFLATSKGAFAGFLWLAHGAYDEDEVRCRYELTDTTRTVWDYDVYIEPKYRLGRMFSRLWQAANHALASEGVRWSISRISTFNPDSIAAHSRLGAQTLSHATFVVLGPAQLALVSQAPYLHVSLRAASAPTVRLKPPAGNV
ncbi:GNAT family N-acetyltransferase [Nitrogeniibacter aestuarii]|uniref:GNAT family N-acetyltransferase n=1 Tax=Nitrogeniibacter aestuarii TaxID=2815343 RepID=UPI001D123004|nr:GNAT family N-acetyltransferase [Nitrogeniibacter aestuarii]